MNEAIRNMYERRSVRKFDAEQVERNALLQVLDAGLHAPSAKNQQPWFFAAVQKEEGIADIRRVCADACGFAPDLDPFYAAPTVIVVFTDPSGADPVKDASLAMQNMMLAAHSIGLGSCWVNCVKVGFLTEEGKAVSKAWGVPEGYIPVGSLALGKPAADYVPREKEIREKYVIVE